MFPMASKPKSLSLQVESALRELFNLDSLTSQIKSVVSGHEHTQEMLSTLQALSHLSRARVGTSSHSLSAPTLADSDRSG